MKSKLLVILSLISMYSWGAEKMKYPFYFEHESSGEDRNEMQILHSGIASLQKRIDLIRKAKKRISAEYFIWEQDTAGLLMFHELIKKAQQGVKIRLIIDKSITVIEMNDFFAEVLSKYGIEIRYYNRALDPATAMFRTHRKILVIDGEEGITGGRNIGDDYFDMDEVYGFLDRDVYIKGKAAKAMEDSFDVFWDEEIVKKSIVVQNNPQSRRIFRDRRRRETYHDLREAKYDEQRKEAQEWIDGHVKMESVAEQVEKVARPILESYPVIDCPKVTYVSDLAGITGMTYLRKNIKKFRVLRDVLFDKIKNDTRGTYYLASPYFMLNEDWQELLSYVIGKKKVKTVLYTNSLGSTDAFYVASNFYRIIFSWQDFGLIPWIHNSEYNDHYPVYNEKVEASRWGMHEKTQVFNDESFYIGTYNIDNRSDMLNVEMGLFCEGSKELTADLVESMQRRYLDGYKISGKEQAVDKFNKEADVYGNATQGQIRLMKSTTPLNRLLEPLM